MSPPDVGARPSTPRLSATVAVLGVVSLLTDLASEMIIPLLPAFLASIGAAGVFIGLVDGVAEATAAFGKLASGHLADRARAKKPLVVLGYLIAGIARPLVALATAPWHVLAIRFSDRVGKGIRSSPRDALIADVTPLAHRGAAFGFHRAMDHAGAVLGALCGWALLSFTSLGLRGVFAAAAIPGVLGLIVLVAGVREVPRPVPAAPAAPAAPPAPRVPLSPLLRRYLAVTGLFTLACASDAFLLLRAIELGVPTAATPLLWAALHVVKALLSTPFGALADRVGRRRVVAIGWAVYALVYVGFALASSVEAIVALFLVYGAHHALVEGAEKAVVADLAPEGARGRAFGAFHFVTGLAALPASIGFGVLWDHAGHATALASAAGVAGLAAVLLPVVVGSGGSSTTWRPAAPPRRRSWPRRRGCRRGRWPPVGPDPRPSSRWSRPRAARGAPRPRRSP